MNGVRAAMWLAALASACLWAADDPAKIMRPADRSTVAPGTLDIVATAPGGRLALDGKPVAAEQPFPAVWHARVAVAAGAHTLALEWERGRKEVRFFAGPGAPADFLPFRPHPPGIDAACTECHELSPRGRFRFKNDACFDCHQRPPFVGVHSHEIAVLAECGLCHNAHGSTVKAHLLYPKEQACKLCHN